MFKLLRSAADMDSGATSAKYAWLGRSMSGPCKTAKPVGVSL
jgi:hypothetical protein